jgi:hypothetical protein
MWNALGYRARDCARLLSYRSSIAIFLCLVPTRFQWSAWTESVGITGCWAEFVALRLRIRILWVLMCLDPHWYHNGWLVARHVAPVQRTLYSFALIPIDAPMHYSSVAE